MLSGEGARRYGGRWNSPGLSTVYLGDSLALAAMELLVHLRNVDALRTYRKLPVYIPDEVVMHIDPGELPPGWEAGSRTTTRLIGDRWLEGSRSVVLQVPSAVVVGETNFVLNPTHRDMHLLEAGPVSDFRFDRRLGPAGNNLAGRPRDGTTPPDGSHAPAGGPLAVRPQPHRPRTPPLQRYFVPLQGRTPRPVPYACLARWIRVRRSMACSDSALPYCGHSLRPAARQRCTASAWYRNPCWFGNARAMATLPGSG